MEKLNLMLTLAGTAVSVREPIDKADVKSRKGKEVGQAKINQEVQIIGISWDDWYKRSEAAIAILKGGKMGKADKRLSDAEDQIEDLTEKLNEKIVEAEDLTEKVNAQAAEIEQHLAYIKELEGRHPAQDSDPEDEKRDLAPGDEKRDLAPGEEAKEPPQTEVE